jgi:[protein-PII] uridylyltransferase
MVRNLRRFAYGKYRSNFAHAADIFLQIDHPEILYLAALFHDIAKGRDGDHSQQGAVDALNFCRDLPMSEEHAQRVAWLVEQHLVMSQTAQRRDISDPETIQGFCEVIGNQTQLDYLYLVTIADIAATSPKLWNNWKDSLLWELYAATSDALADGGTNIIDRQQRIEETRLVVQGRLLDQGVSAEAMVSLWNGLPSNVFLRFSADQLEWATATVLKATPGEQFIVAVREVAQQGVSELLVHSKDYDGLFAAVTVVIDEIGLDVLSARVLSSSTGMSFDLFQLMDRHGQMVNKIDSARLQKRLLEVLASLTVPVPAVRKLPRRLRPFRTSVRVRFSAAFGGEMTLMDIACADRPGLLSQISYAMVSRGIRIHDARITTLGDRVEDAFIISDKNKQPLNLQMRNELRDALIETLSEN